MLRKKYLKNMTQFISYLVVGGGATVVEWALFFLFVYPMKWDQNAGFTVAYLISTFVNMILGRLLTFRNASVVNQSNSAVRNFLKEAALIYLVAAVGCVLNLLFLNLFTDFFGMDSMTAKILTTGIMLIGNYLARKLGIYRENTQTAAAPTHLDCKPEIDRKG
ncbi:GtrA family protein [Caproicibacter fermentans]|uniref:GtrA family protein n=1 Tax=Caproicibacter fermentans TaxID=2576756 RepID=A0A7G8T917_9FIRM|nr:GtrA family protein [Caproicibacter fermentans]QNK40108.1 GtrA family protein [Caproicibacter fermentans]